MPGSGFHIMGPFQGGGARSSDPKNQSLFKGSRVVYQVKGLDESVSDFIYWGLSKWVGLDHQVPKNQGFVMVIV
jgi:hypothetical protein